MMDIAGYASEAEYARKNGDMARFHELQEKIRKAQAQESHYSEQRRKLEQAADAITTVDASADDLLRVDTPKPQYYLSESQKNLR